MVAIYLKIFEAVLTNTSYFKGCWACQILTSYLEKELFLWQIVIYNLL